MRLSVGDVRAVARLARLALSPEDTVRMVGELTSVLEHVAVLSEAPVSSLSPAQLPACGVGDLRRDVVESWPGAADLIARAPQQTAGQFVVPRIVEAP
ncbi:MAG: Asp-tRNA(Asn)/Glu-tRNA(Gln) amidotransferase subunit GatC [Firmicutes bacterium]|jgi:aspartyl-tRNA(Asn)/glutamyl-tRNA(Gln) amidotransferase subunit C|nr:Asp-tRNA(Asn)/Glu-tRNA(Gln) amidotransferase subunit GatC [Bacillota bacterium]